MGVNEMEAAEESSLTFHQGVKDCIPTLLGYISIGFAAGMIGVASGLSVMEIAFMAVFVYAGAAQFIICGMIAAGSPASAIIFTTFIVNLRHFLLSATLAPHFSNYSLWKNAGIGTLVTDESFGVAAGRIFNGRPVNDRWMNGLNLTAYTTWIASCVVGALLGRWVADPEKFGLDFALTAMFIALLVLQIESIKASKLKHYLMLIFLMVAAMYLFSAFVSVDLAVILSTVIVATIGVVTSK
ncbi:branched-chain amino acid ABC transporter permease [Bacillus badius]|nr:AzlC family ABC transporter permease [Bacillus badius]KZN99855.1 branched-chain amino acid ABC transporter permease [Bacillus badius]OCS85959.1 branched-chain amino acid ABC transporter permease [Bacillus badius]OVE51997.1 branched-chain amino acid ABC transporter permease [Bacillus badius]